jgi:hypothetical protein
MSLFSQISPLSQKNKALLTARKNFVFVGSMFLTSLDIIGNSCAVVAGFLSFKNQIL